MGLSSLAGVIAVAVVLAGCSRPTRPLETRLEAIERGDSPTTVFSDVMGVPFVRDSLRGVDATELPDPLPPSPGPFPRPLSPRNLCPEIKPRFTWMTPASARLPYELVVWEQKDDGNLPEIARVTTESTSLESPVTLEWGKRYLWSVFMPEARGTARSQFRVADEKSGKAMLAASATLERGVPDRPTCLLLQANLFESRGFFGEASVKLRELFKQYPKSAHLKQRCHRLSIYLE